MLISFSFDGTKTALPTSNSIDNSVCFIDWIFWGEIRASFTD